MATPKPRETPKLLGNGDADAFDEVYRRIRAICYAEGKSPTIERLKGTGAESQHGGMYGV